MVCRFVLLYEAVVKRGGSSSIKKKGENVTRKSPKDLCLHTLQTVRGTYHVCIECCI